MLTVMAEPEPGLLAISVTYLTHTDIFSMKIMEAKEELSGVLEYGN